MCLIIYRPAGAKLEVTREMLGYACDANPHGFGIMWQHDGRVQVAKYLPNERAAFIKRALALQAQPAVSYAVHMRWATHGGLTKDNVHPFWIRKGQSALMHNGILNIACANGMSDTRTFVHGVMRALPDDWASNPALFYLVQQATSGSKLVILEPTGPATIVNEKLGHWKDGVWFSGHSYCKPVSWLASDGSGKGKGKSDSKSAARTGSSFALVIPSRAEKTAAETTVERLINRPAESARQREIDAEIEKAWAEHFSMSGKPGADPDAPELYYFEGLVLCSTCLRMETSAPKAAHRIQSEPGDVCELCTYTGKEGVA